MHHDTPRRHNDEIFSEALEASAMIHAMSAASCYGESEGISWTRHYEDNHEKKMKRKKQAKKSRRINRR